MVVALDKTSMAVDSRGASSAMLEVIIEAKMASDRRLLILIMMMTEGMKCALV